MSKFAIGLLTLAMYAASPAGYCYDDARQGDDEQQQAYKA
jgi:hypothetical protein